MSISCPLCASKDLRCWFATERLIVCGCEPCNALFTIQLGALQDSMSTALPMADSFYPKRNGDYVYDVTVTKDDTVRLSHRYRAHLSNAERIEDGRLPTVQVDVHGLRRTVSERCGRSMPASRRGVGSIHPDRTSKLPMWLNADAMRSPR
jgi:hypothetical protein